MQKDTYEDYKTAEDRLEEAVDNPIDWFNIIGVAFLVAFGLVMLLTI